MDSSNTVLLSNISIDSDVPLYYQIISVIKRNLAAGMIKPGDMLPSETAFCETYNISRTTIRQAIGELEAEGLVVRRRGKGTFISEPKMKRKMQDIYSFSKEMRSMGLVPSSRVLGFEVIEAEKNLADNMGLKAPKTKVFKIVRIRLANDEPLLLETTYVPYDIYPQLSRDRLESESLYSIITGVAGIIPASAEESYETILIDKSIAELLKCKANSCGFFVERKAWSQADEVYELTQSIIRGDRTKFVVRLSNNDLSFNRNINDVTDKKTRYQDKFNSR